MHAQCLYTEWKKLSSHHRQNIFAVLKSTLQFLYLFVCLFFSAPVAKSKNKSFHIAYFTSEIQKDKKKRKREEKKQKQKTEWQQCVPKINRTKCNKMKKKIQTHNVQRATAAAQTFYI